jgi:hypothetical protein
VLAILAGVGAGLWARHQHIVKTRYPGEWREYVEAYNGWFGTLWGQRDHLQKDPVIDEEVANPLGKMSDINPRHWAEAASVDPQSPPDHAGVPGLVHDTLAVVHRIQYTLAGKGKPWPALARVQQKRDEFAKRQWNGPVEVLDKAIKELESPSETLPRAINTILVANANLDAVENAWGPVEQQIHAFAAVTKEKDPVLGAYEAYCLAQVKQAAQKAKDAQDEKDWPGLADAQLKAIAAALVEARKPGAEAYAFLAKGDAVEWAKMRGESDVYKGKFQQPEIWAQWAKAAPAFLVWTKPDPRQTWTVEAKLTPIDETLARLDSLVKGDKIEYPDLPALQQERDKLKARRDEIVGLKWGKQTNDAVEGGIKEVDSRLAALKVPSDSTIQNLIAHHTELTLKAITDIAAEAPGVPPVLSAAFATHRDSMVAKAKQAVRVGTLKADVDALRQSLLKYDANFKVDLGISSVRPWNAQAASALKDLAEGQRVRLLGEAIKSLKFTNDQPDEESFEDERAKRIIELKAYNDSAVAFVSALNKVEDLLDQSYGPSEKFDGTKSINAIVAEQATFAQIPSVKAAIAPVLARIKEVDDVAGLQDRARLKALAGGKDKALAWAGWRRLMEMNWPGTMAELPEAAALRGTLKTMADGVEDGTRKKALSDALAEAGVKIADRFLSSGTDDASVNKAVELVLANNSKLGIGQDNQLPGLKGLSETSRFNCIVYAEKKLDRNVEGVKEDVAQGWIKDFSTQLDALVPVGKLTVKDGLAAELTRLAREKEEAEATAGEGAGPSKSPIPALKGIKPIKSADNKTLTFAIGAQTLKFVLVKPSPGAGVNCYMSATEVSIGLVREIMDMAQKGPADVGLPKPDDSLSLVGMGWRLAGSRGVVSNKVWMTSIPGKPFYTPQSMGSGGEPSADHPMQLVPPSTAMYLATLLGCRLPTTAEWTAALPMQNDLPNLRDEQWVAQREYVRKLDLSTGAPWPDAGCFIAADEKAPQDAGTATAWTATALGESLAKLKATGIKIPGAGGQVYADGAAFYTLVQGQDKTGISNLIGNVAEIVWDDSKWVEEGKKEKTLADMREISKDIKKIGVVGGSAISPPEMGLGRRNWSANDRGKGYADVGFRLAFRATKPTIAQQFKELVQAVPYAVATK